MSSRGASGMRLGDVVHQSESLLLPTIIIRKTIMCDFVIISFVFLSFHCCGVTRHILTLLLLSANKKLLLIGSNVFCINDINFRLTILQLIIMCGISL